MNKLDENKIYDLLELTSEELEQVYKNIDTPPRRYNYLSFNQYGHVWSDFLDEDKVLVSAKELFYTLENVQVDCRELSEEQIKEMVDVFENNGYKQWTEPDAFKIENGFTYLRTDWANEFYINGESGTKTTITYDKFMELFTPQYEVTMIAEQPKDELCDNLKPLINAVEMLNDLKTYKEKSEEILTLENVQVDCRNLTEGQIKEMTDVFESKGYCYFENDKEFSLSIIADTSYLHIYEGEIIIDSMVEGLKEITYEKFMELFGDTLVGDVIETTDEVSPISSREKELKKTLKYLLKKDIILTPKQYKKLWKGL